MTTNLDGFVSKWNGQYADFDGAYGAQCADLFNFYTKEVAGGNPYASTYMGAQDIGNNKLTFGGVYEVLSPDIMGKKGDVVIWSGSFGSYLGGGFGHVAIMVADENPAGTVRVLSQNPGPATIMDLTTNGCIAYLRPTNRNPVAPKPVTGTNQRVVGSGGVNYRKEASTSGASIQLFTGGDVLDFKGYVHGQAVEGNNVWFVGAYTGGFAWSGGFTNSSVSGLNNLTPVVAPKPPVTPVKPPVEAVKPPVVTPPTSLVAELDCVTEYIPAHVDNYALTPFPDSPEKVVIHQFGTKGKDTFESSINWFKMGQDARGGAGPSSAHFVVDGDRIVQMVSIHNRAYHAGSGGNDFIGIESSPYQDAKTIASVRKLIMELNSYYNKSLTPILHKQVPGAATNCGSDINLKNYEGLEVEDKITKDQILDALDEVTWMVKNYKG